MHSCKRVFSLGSTFTDALLQANFFMSLYEQNAQISREQWQSQKRQPDPGYGPSTSTGETNDDSVILMSSADSPSVTDRCRLIDKQDSGGGHYKSDIKPKTETHRPRQRLFNSSSTPTSARSSNDTIDLVDDDDDDDDDPVYHPPPYFPNPRHPAMKTVMNDVIILDEDSISDLQESTVSTTSSSTPNSQDTITENDCEIIAVKVVTKTQSSGGSTRASRRKSPGNKLGSRRSSLSLNTVRLSVDRARKRISLSNLGKPSVMSHGIRKKKKKGNGGQGPKAIKGTGHFLVAEYRCVEFFKRRGHEVVACIPQFRRKPSESVDTDILETMEKEGTVKFTPSREVGGQRIAPYDDRFIIQYAHMKDAFIISNDNFKGIYDEVPEWKVSIRFR